MSDPVTQRPHVDGGGVHSITETVTYRYLTPKESAADARANYQLAIETLRRKVAGGPLIRQPGTNGTVGP